MKRFTRVQYKKLPKSFKLVSKDKYLGHFDFYTASIDTLNFNYEIKSLSGKIVVKGSSVSLHDAKKKVKQELKKLGVNFYDEIRQEVI